MLAQLLNPSALAQGVAPGLAEQRAETLEGVSQQSLRVVMASFPVFGGALLGLIKGYEVPRVFAYGSALGLAGALYVNWRASLLALQYRGQAPGGD